VAGTSIERIVALSDGRFRVAVACCAVALLGAAPRPLHSQGRDHTRQGPVPVRFSEGTVHGFLELRDDADSVLAFGDLLQMPGDSGVESRMVFQFRDGSLFDETTRFTQQQVFRMETYHLVQLGPAFGADLDATLFRDGRYAVKSTAHKDGKVQRYAGRLDLPADTYNGLPVVIAKNLRPGDTCTVHLVAFTPEPRLIGLRLSYVGKDSVTLGNRAEAVAEFVVKPQLGALTTLFARLLGKLPPDSRVWIVTDQVPAFVRFEGPMYTGPVWRLTLATPDRPK
jgi:hypothetical protein